MIPDVFLSNGALGLARLSEPSVNQSWWVQGSSLEPVRWYKCGMNQDQANLNFNANMDLAHIEVFFKHRG